MFYKIRNSILFRRYDKYGYITDNSEFGYQMLNSTQHCPGETFVSESGAVMLSILKKFPREIDDIVNELSQIFQEVERDVLKEDAIDLFQWLTTQGYLCVGDTFDSCIKQEYSKIGDESEKDTTNVVMPADGCAKDVIRPSEFLRSIHFDITSVCNERCVHCYIPSKDKTKAIDSQLFYRIVEEGRKLNIIHVTLSGGEPLLHKDFIGFLAKCRELDLSVNVLSNLTLLTDEMVAEMKKNPLLSVQTSIYSMISDVHDSITGVRGSLEKTVDSLLKLSSLGIPVQISCPIMKQNKDSFGDVIRWGKNHNIAVAVEPVIFASYDHSGSNLENRLSLEELDSALEKQLQEGYADVFVENARIKESLTGNDPICSVCRYSFCVSVEGNIFPCAGWQTNILGNLNQNTVQELWEKNERIQELRKIKRMAFEKCVSCKDRGYCTVCMMSNANENPEGNCFVINDFHCKASALIHRKVDEYLKNLITN